DGEDTIVKTPAPAAEQGDPAEGEGQHPERRRRPLRLLDERGLILGREVVGVGGGQVVLVTQQGGYLILSGLDVGLAPDADSDALRVRSAQEHPQDERERNEDPVVEVLVGELPLAGLDADHLELVASHSHGLADRASPWKELRLSIWAEHHAAAAEVDAGRGDQSTLLRGLVVDVGVRRGNAEEARRRLVSA